MVGLVRKHMHLFQAIRCGFCDFVAAARQLMRINELLICVCARRGVARRGEAWRGGAGCCCAQKYAIKFYLLIYDRRQICVDYANGIGVDMLICCRCRSMAMAMARQISHSARRQRRS